jgi:hypothetical protein
MATVKPYSDFEDEDVASQIATAQALRNKGLNAPAGQMIGDWYMPTSPLNILGYGIGGGIMEQAARQRQADIQTARQKQDEEYLARLPEDTVERTRELAGPPTEEGVGPGTITERVAKDPRQFEQDMYRYGMSAPNTALGQQMRLYALQRAMTSPERHALAAEKKETALTLAREKIEAEARRAADKAEAQAQRDADKAEARAREIRLTASLRQPREPKLQIIDTVDEQGNPTKQVVELTPGATFKAIPKGHKVSAATEKSLDAANELMSRIQMAKEGLPHYSGIGNIVPTLASQFYTSPETKMANAAMAAVSAEKAHELYGSAFTGPERARAAQFLPNTNDTVEMAQTKLKAMEILVAKKLARLNGKPDPFPDMYNDILDKGGATTSVTPAGNKPPAGGAPAAPAGGAPAAPAAEEWVRDASGKLVRKVK